MDAEEEGESAKGERGGRGGREGEGVKQGEDIDDMGEGESIY